MKSIFLSPDIKVLVVSCGGVGTTFLMDEIGRYVKTNDPMNTDGYKHMPIPPIPRNENCKAIYVTGDPIAATLSLFRRRYQHINSRHNFWYYSRNYVIPENMTIKEYARQGIDGFNFERNFNNWTSKYAVYPTLFVKYNSIYESLDIIAEFLDLPQSFASNFPKKKERKSSLDKLEPDTIKDLKGMYGDFQKKLNGLPGAFQNEIVSPMKISTKYLKRPYLLGYRNKLYRTFPKVKRAIKKLS